MVKGQAEEEQNLDAKDLQEYLGNPIFTKDRAFEVNPVGVVTGLAWTAMGFNFIYLYHNNFLFPLLWSNQNQSSKIKRWINIVF